MTEPLHRFAESDTPSQVNVPNSWPGLIIWALGRFGIGLVFAYGLWVVYGDLKETNKQMMAILQARAVADADLARSLTELTMAITQTVNEARTAHKP
jgi:hypothetical protein